MKGVEQMDIFEYAMQMEADGEDYYRSLAAQTRNKGLKTILTMLADEEVKHYGVLKQIKTDKPMMAQTTILDDARNVFARLKQAGGKFDSGSDQTELYEKARDIEQKSEEFYRQKALEVSQEYQRDLFLRLAEEEKKHSFLLENIIEFVSRPKTWLENAEFNHLEEY
jgi:rubrerythrin